MTLAELIAWALPVLGVVLIVTCSTLFRPVREFFQRGGRAARWFGELITCPMCFGFWAGATLGALGWTLTGWWLLDGWAASFTCWLSHVGLCKLGQGRLLSARPDLKEGGP